MLLMIEFDGKNGGERTFTMKIVIETVEDNE